MYEYGNLEYGGMREENKKRAILASEQNRTALTVATVSYWKSLPYPISVGRPPLAMTKVIMTTQRRYQYLMALMGANNVAKSLP